MLKQEENLLNFSNHSIYKELILSRSSSMQFLDASLEFLLITNILSKCYYEIRYIIFFRQEEIKLKNVICELLNIELPILQGPMAWSSDAVLAAAVSNSGGLGIMGIGFAPEDIFESEIKKAKSLTSKPFGCNIMTFAPNAEKLLEIALREKIPVVEIESIPAFYDTLASYVDKLKEAGIKVIGKAADVKEAVFLEEAGVEMVAVKGFDGGGHIFGMTGTFSLIPQVVDAVKIPVINSSGVADGRGMAASFMLGAAGVEIGSRFVMAKECPVHDNYKDAILKATEGDTVLTGVTVGDAVRGLKNELADEVLKIERQYEGQEAAEKVQELCVGALRIAAVNGDTVRGSVVVGQNIGLLNNIKTAKEIIDDLMEECGQLLAKAPTLV